MGLRRAVIIIFIIALLPLSILEVKADSNIGYQELVEVEVNSADTVEMENARYNRPDSISALIGSGLKSEGLHDLREAAFIPKES